MGAGAAGLCCGARMGACTHARTVAAILTRADKGQSSCYAIIDTNAIVMPVRLCSHGQECLPAQPLSERVMGVGGMRRVVLFAAFLPGFLPSGHTLVAGHGQSTLQSNLQAGRQTGRQGEAAVDCMAARATNA